MTGELINESTPRIDQLPEGRNQPESRCPKTLLREASELGCVIAVFPEMSLTGYLNGVAYNDHFLELESEPAAELVEFSGLESIDVLFGIAERNPAGLPFITQIHASAGKIVGVYRKRNVADDETDLFTPGQDSYQGTIADQSFGVAVCADHEVSDEFVAASKAGASVVFHPAAPGLYGPRRESDDDWQRGFDWWRTSCIERHGRRAKELGISIAVCTQAGATADEDFPGWAVLFGPDGEIVSELPDWRPGTLVVDI